MNSITKLRNSLLKVSSINTGTATFIANKFFDLLNSTESSFHEDNLLNMLYQLILSHQYKTNFYAEKPLDFNYQYYLHNQKLNNQVGRLIKLTSHSIPSSKSTISESTTNTVKSFA